MVRDTQMMKGTIHLLAKHADGEVFCDKVVNNTVTATGKAGVTALMVDDVGGTAFGAIAIGVGTPSATALGSEVPNNTYGGGRRSGANVTGTQQTTSTTSDTAQWVTLFTFSGSYAITEEGIFNSGTISAGTMLASQSFTAVNVISGDTLQITHKVRLT